MIKHLTLLIFFNLFALTAFAQSSNNTVNVGDVFVIGEVENNQYKHINFPKPNFIIKKGGIANFNNLKGKEVEVTAVKVKNDGSVKATIRLTSNKSFFNSHKYVTVDILEAIEHGELASK